MEEKFVGKVIWFNNTLNFGFIKQQNGEPDMFVHYSDIVCEGFKTLKEGQTVAYSIGVNHKGQPKATEVVIVENE